MESKKTDCLYLVGIDKEKKVVRTLTEEEIVENALMQEREGIEPMFYRYDSKTKESCTPKGWLVWSDGEYGCGVVYRDINGNMKITKGWQGEFACS